MNVAVLLATLCGQLPSPQLPVSAAPVASYAAQAAPGPPQTLVLLQYASPTVPAGPSLLVASPPLWDRILARVGTRLVERANKHQHPQAMVAATIGPAQQPAPSPTPVYQLVVPTAPAAAVAPSPAIAATPQGWVPPPPAAPQVILVPQPQDDGIRRLFGGR